MINKFNRLITFKWASIISYAYCLLPIQGPIAYGLWAIAYSIAHRLLPIAFCVLPITYCRLPCLLPIACMIGLSVTVAICFSSPRLPG